MTKKLTLDNFLKSLQSDYAQFLKSKEADNPEKRGEVRQQFQKAILENTIEQTNESTNQNKGR